VVRGANPEESEFRAMVRDLAGWMEFPFFKGGFRGISGAPAIQSVSIYADIPNPLSALP
jgi:hypothetical protein